MASPGSNGNGGAQSCVTGAHLSAKLRQKRGVSIVRILVQPLPQLCVPAPVPEEGLGRLGVLSQGMCLELWYDVWVGCAVSTTSDHACKCKGAPNLKIRRMGGVLVAGQVADCFGSVLGDSANSFLMRRITKRAAAGLAAEAQPLEASCGGEKSTCSRKPFDVGFGLDFSGSQ